MFGQDRFRTRLKGELAALVWAYCASVLVWAALHALVGDAWWWLFLLNTFALYLFAPLPLALGAALYVRRRSVWLAFAAVLGVGCLLYGNLFLPRLAPPIKEDPELTVMTYNLLGINHDRQSVVGVIRAADADVIALQELNHTIAEALQGELANEYPYQILNIDGKWTGAGMISRYPLSEADDILGSRWFEAPQVLTLDFQGQTVTLVHFHTAATTNYHSPEHVSSTVQIRQEQTQAVADFARLDSGPLIATSDFNATDQGNAYKIITGELADSWREAGWGLGHTFPGSDGLGSRFHVMGVPLPRWLIRIDYVFHSEHWQAISARTGRWDGVSDHRPVIVTLRLVEGTGDRSARR